MLNPSANPNCSICQRIERAGRGENQNVVHEFANSLLVVGDHQYFAGYCILLLKSHVRELHELSPQAQQELFAEMMAATTAIANAFSPWKMNHACLGNVDPHVHWHLIPRYDNEPAARNHPWLHADEFANHATDPATAASVAAKIRGFIP